MEYLILCLAGALSGQIAETRPRRTLAWDAGAPSSGCPKGTERWVGGQLLRAP